MQMGQGISGMQTLNQSLYQLFSRGIITLDEAMARSSDTAELQSMIEHGSPVVPAGQRGTAGTGGGNATGRR
jgi:Tfp pilus assembly ATPase PilU